ncbi:MAG: adenosylhomocysteinase [Clostridiales bacterium]|nr:adenosylhomocysteinase [Clostridiales bacterium]
MVSDIKHADKSKEGLLKIEWAKKHMPVLRSIEEDFRLHQPLKDVTIAVSIHLEAKTAYFCMVLAAGGADVYVTGSNPLSTQDDVASALVTKGINVFAWYNATATEYINHLKSVLDSSPEIIIDDGGDLVNLIHSEYQHLLKNIKGGCEETTTGILRLKALDSIDELHLPMMLVNDAKSKHLFDNRYGTGQSVWDAINHTTNLIVASKTVVVAGYGWCGKGVAMRAKGLGANVVITEIDAIKAVEAKMDGFSVLPMKRAAEIGDVFITVTGCKDVIPYSVMLMMKDSAILCNAGHFNVEIAMDELESKKISKTPVRKNIKAYLLENNKTIHVLAQGRLVNLAAGDGHPVEIMDMSFSLQALCANYINNHKLTKGIYNVPEEVDQEVAIRKLSSMEIEIDQLTEDQKKYLNLQD